jgi:hypothetical protein
MGTVYGSRHLSNMFKPQNWSPGFLRIWNHHKPSIFWWYDWLILSHVFLGWNVTSELCFTQLRSASQTVVYSQYKTGDILNSWGAWNPVFFYLRLQPRRGGSRRIDSKTSRVSYQASVSFENVIFRSKYRHDIQGALDHHIVPWCIRTLGIGDTGIQKLRTPKKIPKSTDHHNFNPVL